MSSSELFSGPVLRRCVLVLGMATLLGGCFRPLYADSTQATTGGSVKANMAAIKVGAIPDRMGHFLRNELVFDLNVASLDVPERYLLDVKVTEYLDVTVTDYSTGRADSATLVATATYTLTEIGKDKPILNTSSVSRATYDRSTQRYANVAAARDAQTRAAKSLSGLITNRLAAAFAGGF
jgi:LPS-assembly lipoprotein